MSKKLGSIEAGGTKFILAVADETYKISAKKRIPTEDPATTLAGCIAFFKENPVDAIGLGSFGPIGIKQGTADYGHILSTPKPGWAGTDMVGTLTAALHVPVYFTTDVNASVYGEYIAGSAKEVDSAVYFTIGTGIGGGVIQDGKFIGGYSHLEMGHAPVMMHPDDHYEGFCPFHGNRCFEGVAAGPTIEARTGIPGEKLERDNPVFDYIDYYAAQMAFAAYVNYAPEKIIFGGSVINDDDMVKVRQYFDKLNNDYVKIPDNLIVHSHFADNASATVGDFALAATLLK
ncbi:ROK family protein [Lactiplantibacillus sp. WILCCON 0030]|uniref:fructokinase n=1 Tax=Lactiplantibacillus brownii TaxID=3069269 RepID=A0ABU1ACL8_9LACO|nr:ROK family protein [Lactiplantibacillus brownii]MDQ7938694.1 ROK family protein [Lactiplantibacillus brownii]